MILKMFGSPGGQKIALENCLSVFKLND
jgi:hypothetical protein